MLRPCLDCGRPTPGTRCLTHARMHDRMRRPSTSDRGYDAEWQRFSRECIAREPWCHAQPCRWPETAGTPANPLTTDHATLGLVLCRNDNVAKAHADRQGRVKSLAG